MEVEAVYDAGSDAIERARAGAGPELVKCVAYRFEGHHEGDSDFYRDEKELDRWRRRILYGPIQASSSMKAS